MKINLVQGDTGPQIKVTLTRSDTGLVEDVSDATIKMHFRKQDTTNVLFSLTNQSSPDQQDLGVCIFIFSSGQLDVDAGYYEGEVEVVFQSGTRETVYEVVEFYVREDFA
ncbi:hypothetical protein N8508_00715 [bacterium]|nr:hypothetical protein [bacterium]